MSWVSTELYYRHINEKVSTILGRQHSANLLIDSSDFQPIITLQAAGKWDDLSALLVDRAHGLKRAGATNFLIASNTMHLCFANIVASVNQPGLSIFEATTKRLRDNGIHRVGLLGTRYTMRDPFFIDAYAQGGIAVMVPTAPEAARVNEIIFKELIHNKINPTSKEYYLAVVHHLAQRGAEAIVLGCTEIGLLLDGHHASPPLYDTARIHADFAVDWLTST